jgi:HAD superfamily 5'-nucleotidase-like hydrolase
MTSFSAHSLFVNRPVDFDRIRAVGFDLDHTLALYDDAAVNALAMAEAQRLLVDQRGYHDSDVAVAPRAGDAASARALALDLTQSHVVKLDADRRVRVARRAGVWLASDEIARAHADPVSEHNDAVHFLSSPFDVPTLWLFEAITRARGEAGINPLRACRDARQMLDYSHTRGELKRHLLGDLTRFVAPVAGVRERLLAWLRAGKTLFVVTNSESAYAMEVLDVVVGPQWSDIFDIVAASSSKPAFFQPGSTRASRSTTVGRSQVVEGADAKSLEAHLGVRAEDVIYVGDNARHDVQAARAHGWKTVHVVAELAATHAADHFGWGSPFVSGDAPSWFARVMRETADVVCDRVDRLLDLDPTGRLDLETTGVSAWGESP